MQTKLALGMVVFSLLIGGLALYISFLPELVYVQVETNVNKEDHEVDEYLSNPANWENWIVGDIDLIERSMVVKNESGDSLILKWWSKEIGDGALELLSVDSVRNTIRYQMVTDNALYREKGELLWEKTIGGTKIVWKDTLDISTNLTSRWMAGDGLEEMVESGNQNMLNQLRSELK